MYRVELKALFIASTATPTICKVPNVPCGVESMTKGDTERFTRSLQFLMYRVELKAFIWNFNCKAYGHVPNVPCGVESYSLLQKFSCLNCVPNVPCGVERTKCEILFLNYLNVPNVPCGVERRLLPPVSLFGGALFLMYRVELKVLHNYQVIMTFVSVPNVPCGVKRWCLKTVRITHMCWWFLMYRVELKEFFFDFIDKINKQFLMYRVSWK